MAQCLLDLLYPPSCEICQRPLIADQRILCLRCRISLPRTNYSRASYNPVEQHFWGRLAIRRATAFLHFRAAGKLQSLIHDLKYKGRKDIGRFLGELMGKELTKDSFFEGIDAVIPVPMHPQKQKRRGYNQAEIIAEGLASSTQLDLYADQLQKTELHESQTRKSRYERFVNVKESFRIRDPGLLSKKHILLLDDVITTGATIEACGQCLISKCDCKISVLTLAATE